VFVRKCWRSGPIAGANTSQIGILYLSNVFRSCSSSNLKDIPITHTLKHSMTIKVKGFPYSIPSVGPGVDPGVQAVSLQVTVSHPPGGRLPLLSARPAVTSSVAEHHRPSAGTKLYCLVTEAHRLLRSVAQSRI